MRRFLCLACCLVSLTASAAVSKSHNAPAGKLTAAQIVARNVDARGGLEAWRAAKTLTMTGKLEAGSEKNPELPFVLKMKRAHMSRLEILFQNQTAVQVYDGVQGWKVRPFLGRSEVEPFTADERNAAVDWQELDGPLIDYAKKGIKVKLQGTESVEGQRAYKLKLTMNNGVERHVWVDAKTFLERKIDGEPRMLDGKLRNVAIFYREYKKENGLTMPHILETVVDGGKQPYKMHIEHVAINQAMENALFAKPQLAVANASMQQNR
ncbi:outer membrane lipoprotein-sorting protein [Sideroxydans sp. CL21]|uniref:outer membrane lipoprotein-sorting protein n=1 Tax=Sideroxydans sp. CL21 TaxID=2600596 RepID=UPI0024BD24AF|nr:outer membrane lipoprotein-sorting protein [Sideroxydans sp. CL21]